MDKVSEKIVPKIYTTHTLRQELLEEDKNLKIEMIEKKLRWGEFGSVQWLKKDEFIIKSNAVWNYINKPLKGKKREKIKKVLLPKYTEDEAESTAKIMIDKEIDRRAKWMWNLDLDSDEFKEEKERRMKFYKENLMREYSEQSVDMDITMAEIERLREYPYDLMNYVAIRYTLQSERDYFIDRYMSYLEQYDIEIGDPKCDTILRNVIDDEIQISILRQMRRSSASMFNEDINKALDSAIKRWNEMAGGLGILSRRGKIDKIPGTKKKEKGILDDVEKRRGKIK